MNYPIICLNVKASQDSLFAQIILENELRTTSIDWFNKFLLNQEFCDSNGNLYHLRRIVPWKKDWRLGTILSNKFKPGNIYRYEFVDKKSKIELNEFKLICKEIAKHMFVESAWQENFDEIDSGKTHKESMECMTITG